MQEQATVAAGLDSLLAEIDRLAFLATPEIILSAVTEESKYKSSVDIYETALNMGSSVFEDCKTCGPLHAEYVSLKLAVRRKERKSADRLFSRYGSILSGLRKDLEKAQDQFHNTPCTCGLQRWKGARWRNRQSPEYKSRYQDYIMWEHSRKEA